MSVPTLPSSGLKPGSSVKQSKKDVHIYLKWPKTMYVKPFKSKPCVQYIRGTFMGCRDFRSNVTS